MINRKLSKKLVCKLIKNKMVKNNLHAKKLNNIDLNLFIKINI